MIHVHIPANLFYPELPGGSNQYFRYGPYLRERGVQLHVHTIRKPHHEEEEIEKNGIRIRRYEVPKEFNLLDELELVTQKAIKEIGPRPKNVCVHPLGTTQTSLHSIKRLWKARWRGIPTCFHYMMVPVRERHRFPGNLKEFIRMRLDLSPYQKMIMCSHVMGRAFTQVAGVSPDRIEVVPNGIDLDVFSPVSGEVKRDLRLQLHLPEHSPIVLFVGSVIARKGVDTLIEAWELVHRQNAEARLVIVGSTRPRPTIRETKDVSESEQYFERVGAQIDRLDDPESVLFAGEVDNIRDYYRASDLFAFASLREGLPSVILESMACGVPCVTTPFIGIPDDGEEYGVAEEHYVQSSYDPEVLAGDIWRMLDDDEARLKMGEKAAAWIAETQEMGKAADRLAEIYRDLVEGK